MATSSRSAGAMRADFLETAQLQICSFKRKQWIKLTEGVVTIDYVSNLQASHNIVLTIASASPSSSSYCYQMTPPFEIQQKDKQHQTQYMLKAKDVTSNEPALLALIFSKVPTANRFYNLIMKGGPSSCSGNQLKIIRKHTMHDKQQQQKANTVQTKAKPSNLRRISIMTSTTDNTDHEDLYDEDHKLDAHKHDVDEQPPASHSSIQQVQNTEPSSPIAELRKFSEYSQYTEADSLIVHCDDDEKRQSQSHGHGQTEPEEDERSERDVSPRWQCKCCTVINDQCKMSCVVCRTFNDMNWVCNYCRFHNCAFRHVCMVCNVRKNAKMINKHNLQQWSVHDLAHYYVPYQSPTASQRVLHRDSLDDDFTTFMKRFVLDDNNTSKSDHSNEDDDEEEDDEEVEMKSEQMQYTKQEYAKWKDDMKWIISIIIREHGLKARKKLYKLEIITKNLMKMEPKYRRFPQSKRTHSLLNGIKQFIEWIGFQTCQNARHHSQKFILLNTPPKWQLTKTANLLKSYRDRLTLPCKISKEKVTTSNTNTNTHTNSTINAKANKSNTSDHKRWIQEFEHLCDDNKILLLMIDQAIIHETHPYNAIHREREHGHNAMDEVHIHDEEDHDEQDEQMQDNEQQAHDAEDGIVSDLEQEVSHRYNNHHSNNDDILSTNKSHKHNKAMSIKTVISFVGIFLDGVVVLNKLLATYRRYDEGAIHANLLRYNSVKNDKPMSPPQVRKVYKSIQEYIIDIIKYWLDQYWQFHFIVNHQPTVLLVTLYQILSPTPNQKQKQLQHRHCQELTQLIEYKYKSFTVLADSESMDCLYSSLSSSLSLSCNQQISDIESTVEFLINTDLNQFAIEKSVMDIELFQSTKFHEWILWGIAFPKYMDQNQCRVNGIYDECYKFRQTKCKNIVKLFNEYDLFIRWIQFIIYSAYKRHLDLLASSDTKSDHVRSYFKFACLVSIFVEMGINFDELHNYHSLSAVYYALNTNPIKGIIDSQRQFIMNALCNCSSTNKEAQSRHTDACQGRNCDEQFDIVRKRWDHLYDPNALYSNFRQTQKTLWKSINYMTVKMKENSNTEHESSNTAPYFVPYFTLIFASIVEYYQHYLHSQWTYIQELSSVKYNENVHMLQHLKHALLNEHYVTQTNQHWQTLMRLPRYKASSEQCLRLMVNLHCKISRLFDRCDKVRKKYAVSDVCTNSASNSINGADLDDEKDSYDVQAFLQIQFQQMLSQ